MRRCVILSVVFSLLIVLVYADSVQKDVWGTDIPYSPSIPQEQDTWCFYAVLEVFTSLRQAYIASRYQRFLQKVEGVEPIDCEASPHLCGGVKYKHIVSFWNDITHDRKTELEAISGTYYLGTRDSDVALPRPGIIVRSDKSAHAVVVYYVEIYHNEANSCVVKYNDPMTGKEEWMNNNWGPINIRILK